MQRVLAVILIIAGPILVVLGFIISSADGAAIKYGAMFGGVILEILGITLFQSTIKPEPIKRRRDYKEPGKLDLDSDGFGSASVSTDPATGEPKPVKSKRIDL